MDECITVIRPVLGFVAGLFFFLLGLSPLLHFPNTTAVKKFLRCSQHLKQAEEENKHVFKIKGLSCSSVRRKVKFERSPD